MQPTLNDIRLYGTQKNNAKRRSVDFKLTFEQWWDWWQSTGHYSKRGRGKGKFCMGRIGDTGAYELGNIYCSTYEGNTSAAQKGKAISRKTKDKMSLSHQGKTLTQEHKDNISAARKARQQT
jgi:hypothetical protein